MNCNCKNCHEDVTRDGYGELIHVLDRNGMDVFFYGCEPGKRGGEYPVAE